MRVCVCVRRAVTVVECEAEATLYSSVTCMRACVCVRSVSVRARVFVFFRCMHSRTRFYYENASFMREPDLAFLFTRMNWIDACMLSDMNQIQIYETKYGRIRIWIWMMERERS